MEHEEIILHGHRVSYRRAGWGPVIVLIHGITGSSQTWEDVIEACPMRSATTSMPAPASTALLPKACRN